METATTLATIPAILALVNLLKGIGLSGKRSALAAVLIGVIVCVADTAASGGDYYTAVVKGVLLGLGASGLYDAMPATSLSGERGEGLGE